MARLKATIEGLSRQLQSLQAPIVDLQYTSAPFSNIVNRAQMVDVSKDAFPRMGIERILFNDVVAVRDEVGSAGQQVFKCPLDFNDQVRFAGPWVSGISGDANGFRASLGANDTANPNHFVEITFYGTGLVMLMMPRSTTLVMDVDVDNAVGTSITIGGFSTIYNGKNHAANMNVNVVQNLALGLHTVRIKGKASNNQEFSVYGFDVVNSPTALRIPEGRVLSDGDMQQIESVTSAYNSGFTNEYGTSGTRGGAVLGYILDGQFRKDVRWTNTAQANMSSADHTNEEIVFDPFWRMYGSGRTDDFTIGVLQQGSNPGFTMDDALHMKACQTASQGNLEFGVSPNPVMLITFEGTGFDFFQDFSITPTATYNVFVDGTQISTNTLFNTRGIHKIVSGLPYGTHTVRFVESAGGVGSKMTRPIFYAPKMPTLPERACPVAAYYICSNYSVGTVGIGNMSTGVTRKHASREMLLSGTWAYASNDTNRIGYAGGLSSTTSGGYLECIFYGTGFEVRGESSTGDSNSITVSLQNLTDAGSLQTLNSTNFPGLTAASYGGFSFNYASGAYAANGSNNAGSGFSVTGMSLKLWKIRLTNNTANTMRVDAVDIVTPIRSKKINPQPYQNSVMIGSQSVGDIRNIPQKDSITLAAKNVGITGNLTTNTSFNPIADMVTSFYLDEESVVEYIFDGRLVASGSVTGEWVIVVDGIRYTPIFNHDLTTNAHHMTFTGQIKLGKGFHTAYMIWQVAGGTGTASNVSRACSIKKVS